MIGKAIQQVSATLLVSTKRCGGGLNDCDNNCKVSNSKSSKSSMCAGIADSANNEHRRDQQWDDDAEQQHGEAVVVAPSSTTTTTPRSSNKNYNPNSNNTNSNNHHPRGRWGSKLQVLAIATVSLVLLFSVPSEDRYLRYTTTATSVSTAATATSTANPNSDGRGDRATTAMPSSINSPFVLKKDRTEEENFQTADARNNIALRPSTNAGGIVATDDAPFPTPSQSSSSSSSSSSPPSLKIAWLMSFPNSGTSYTIKLIRHLTETLTASNYGQENRGFTGESVPVYTDQPSGPYWSDPTEHPEYDLPTEYVMTKTHCGSRCIKCGPYRYVETTFSFLNNCLTGHRVRLEKGVASSGNKTYGVREVLEDVIYPADRVSRAIHLIRSPFDNVVSRFHLETHTGKSATEYPRTPQGFRAFCQRMNEGSLGEEQHALFLDNKVLEVMADVPCRSDFIRYIQWHNLAFATTHDLGLDTYVLHYDWYATRFNDTIRELLEFLKLKAKSEPAPFVLGKIYADDHFTAEERQAVRIAFEAMASKTAWQHVSKYFA